MKFILVLALCSQSYGSCMPPVQNNIYYNSFRDCTMAGYEESLTILKTFSIEEFEKSRIYTSFACTPQGIT